MRRTLCAAAMFGLLAPVCCGTDVLDRKLRVLAGPDATDCGRVEIRKQPKIATDCALNAHLNRKPFFVRYDLQGIDSQVADGFAGNARGDVYGVQFDSMGFSSEGLPKQMQLTDGGHIIIEQCTKPVKLRTSQRGMLTCFLRDP